jgi:2,4-dienoyl-CoA reductase-like NADH-dependent reductase (Old Yellow Enzyme family)/thioredoxin reductase
VPASDLQNLFTPLGLGPVELQNRIVSTAHQTTLVHDHLPTDAFCAYHEARARGGVGLIVLEATAVHESGLLTPHTLGGYLPAIAAGYRRVAAAVRPHGTRLFVQLFHGGREQISTPPRPPALAPSAVPTRRFRTEPRSLLEEEILEILGGYARGAELAAEGGLDGIEVSAAHRYLIEQFFDPALNQRTDQWRDGRLFFGEVLRAVRGAAPGLCLGVRVSADSQHVRALADVAVEEGVDYVSLALGDSSTYLGSVGIVPPPPLPENAIVARADGVAAGLPRILTSRIVDPRVADDLVHTRHADAVGMTRALIADPDMPAKARAGRSNTILTCIGCNACIAHYHAGTAIACAVNPRTGRERELDAVRQAPARGRVAVVGAGPAGLAAALDAAGAGHEVVLFEGADRAGGQMLLAEAAPGGRDVAAAFLANTERQLAAAHVELRLGTRAGADDVADADAVVLATGARPFRDPSLQLEGVEVLDAWDVLSANLPSSSRIVVADWGGDPSGLDAAEVLAGAGKTVTLAVSSVAVGELVHQYRRNLYLRRLYRAGVTIAHHSELQAAEAGVVTLRNVFAPDQVTAVDAECVVLALGRVPDDSLAGELTARGIPFADAGDCRSPRSLEEAVLEGTLASRRVLA